MPSIQQLLNLLLLFFTGVAAAMPANLPAIPVTIERQPFRVVQLRSCHGSVEDNAHVVVAKNHRPIIERRAGFRHRDVSNLSHLP